MKQKNKKLIKKNLKNKILNQKYYFKISKLIKYIIIEIQIIKINLNLIKIKNKVILNKILKNLNYLLDKSLKKKILHKNTINRKKSKINKYFFNFFKKLYE